MHFCRVLTFTVLATFPTIFALSGPEVAAYFELALSPGSQVYLPTDSNYTVETTQRWNAFSAPTYMVSVKPAMERDVQKIINYAAHHNVSFLGTGGGHGYSTTLGSVRNGIEIDLGLFNDVSIHDAAGTMTVGGSVHFANITAPVFAAGKEIPVGSCSCVGVVGATLGGGIGAYVGLHGLIMDSLVSVRMVTGTGELLTVSATRNADLFWGMQGAGFNYGIVTSATYKLYNLTNGGQAMNADMRFLASANGSIWEIMKSFQDNEPDKLSLDLGIAYDEAFGGTYFLLNVIYVGMLAEGLDLIRPFLDLGPTAQNITMLPWKDLETSSRFGVDKSSCVKGRYHSVWSLNLYNISVPTLTEVTGYIADTFVKQPALQHSVFALVQYARRVTELVPDDATAYPYRNTVAYVHFDVAFANLSMQNAAGSFGAETRTKLLEMSGSSDLEVYVNYAHGDEGQAAWYAPRKLPRLLALKEQYDPNSLFNHYNGF